MGVREFINKIFDNDDENKQVNIQRKLRDYENEQDRIHAEQQALGVDIPLAYREYMTDQLCDLLKTHLPEKNEEGLGGLLVTKLINDVMPNYKGKIKGEQILPSDDKPFIQCPVMIKYLLEKNNAPSSTTYDDPNFKNYVNTNDCVLLTYYEPFSSEYFGNSSESNYDDNHKHFYSHFKSEIAIENGDKDGKTLIVINPELEYNSPVHSGMYGNKCDVLKADGEQVEVGIEGYKPKTSSVYALKYENLGLSKEDVEKGFLYVNADINVMKPEIQRSIFKLEENGWKPNEIVELYLNNVDLENTKNITGLIKIKESNEKYDIPDLAKEQWLAKANNDYSYNLTEYNCALKPISAIVFANECKINENKMDAHEANKCREELGFPNVYDIERYEKINSTFEKEYKEYLAKNVDDLMRREIKNGKFDIIEIPPQLKNVPILKDIIHLKDKFNHSMSNKNFSDESRIATTLMSFYKEGAIDWFVKEFDDCSIQNKQNKLENTLNNEEREDWKQIKGYVKGEINKVTKSVKKDIYEVKEAVKVEINKVKKYARDCDKRLTARFRAKGGNIKTGIKNPLVEMIYKNKISSR